MDSNGDPNVDCKLYCDVDSNWGSNVDCKVDCDVNCSILGMQEYSKGSHQLTMLHWHHIVCVTSILPSTLLYTTT